MQLRHGYKQTEMGVIPEDWDVREIGDLEPFVTSGSRGWAEYYSDRGSPFIRITNMSRKSIYLDLGELKFVGLPAGENEGKRTGLRNGDVLVSITADIGIIGYVDESVAKPAYINQHIALVRFEPAKVDSRFVSYFLASDVPQKIFLGSTDLGAKAGMNLSTVRKIRLVFPPLPEQHAIAAAMSDVDNLIASLDQLIAKKRDLKQGAMQTLLTGKIRLPGFDAKGGYKHTGAGVIPEDWQLRPLLTAVRVARGQVDPKIEPYRSMILVAPDHVETGSGRLLRKEIADDQRAISGKYLFQSGDIIYSKIRPYLKKAILADFNGLCSADMYPLRPAPDVSAGFVLAAILGDRFTRFAESVSVRSGMPKINRTELAEYMIGLPPTKAEQDTIAATLRDMDTEILALEARRDKTRMLKQGMMQELLTGRIRLI